MWRLLVCLSLAGAAKVSELIDKQWNRRGEWTNPKAPDKIYGTFFLSQGTKLETQSHQLLSHAKQV